MKKKNGWLCLVFVLAGLVIGSLLGQLASNVSYLWWLNYGREFGISTTNPFTLDINVIKLTFGMMFNLNVASIIGLVISMFIYKKAL